jgi:hypothetical protein
MTLRHSLSIIVLALGASFCSAAPAFASGDAVLSDWRADGTIECNHSLADLRAADAQINPQEREYTFWDEAYSDAVRCVTTGKKTNRPPTVPPQDFDGDGDIDAKDLAIAKKKTKKLRHACKAKDPAKRPKACPNTDDVEDEADEREPDEAIPASNKHDDNGHDDGGFGLLAALLFLVPAAVIGIGAWRMQRSRRSGKPSPERDAPTSSFAGDDSA